MTQLLGLGGGRGSRRERRGSRKGSNNQGLPEQLARELIKKRPRSSRLSKDLHMIDLRQEAARGTIRGDQTPA